MAPRARTRQQSDNALSAQALSILKSLPEKADQLLGLGPSGRGGKPRVHELAALDQRLATLIPLLGPHSQLVATSLRDGPVGLAVLRLLAATLRAIPAPATQQGSSRAGLSTTQPSPVVLDTSATLWIGMTTRFFSLVFYLTGPPKGCPAQAAFIRKLFAMDSVQASAQQLAAAADLLDCHPTTDAAVLETIACVVKTALQLVLCLITYSSSVLELVQRSGLRDSHLLEHAARVLGRMPRSPHLVVAAKHFLTMYGTATMEEIFEGKEALDPGQALFAEAASGPCACFAAMALGLTALCAADGGSWYGLPERVRERLPVLTKGPGQRLRGSDNSLADLVGLRMASLAEGEALAGLAAALHVSVNARRVSRRTAVTVLLRVCRLGLACAAGTGGRTQGGPRAAASAAGSGELAGFAVAAGKQPQPSISAAGRGQLPSAGQAAVVAAGGGNQRLLLAPGEGAYLAARCLLVVRELLAGRPAAWTDVREEWWQAAVALYRPPRDVRDWSRKVAGPAFVQLHPADSISANPPPDLAAALAAGLLPALERLLRRAGEDLWGPEVDVLDGLLTLVGEKAKDTGGVRRFLSPLLAHGDPRQAAALVVSGGKVLRRVLDVKRAVMAVKEKSAPGVAVREHGVSDIPGAGATRGPRERKGHHASSRAETSSPDQARSGDVLPELAGTHSIVLLLCMWMVEVYNVLQHAAEAALTEQASQAAAGGPSSAPAAALPGAPAPAPVPLPEAPPAQLRAFLSCLLGEWLPHIAGLCLDSSNRAVQELQTRSALLLVDSLATSIWFARFSEGDGADRSAAGSARGGGEGSRDAGTGSRRSEVVDGGGGSADRSCCGGDGRSSSIGGIGVSVSGGTSDSTSSGGIGIVNGVGTGGNSSSSCGGVSSCDDAGSGVGGLSGWARHLFDEVRVVPLLGALMRTAGDGDDEDEERPTTCAGDVVEACLALTAACPELVRPAVVGAPCSGDAGGSGSRVREGPSSGAVERLIWWPSDLRRASPGLRRRAEDSDEPTAEALEALACLLELWASGGGAATEGGAAETADALLRVVRSWMKATKKREQGLLAGLLGPPVAASSLLGGPTCANPLCASLKGDSELDVRLQRCGRCGAVGYCCRECQTAHWRAGHKEECSPPGAASGGKKAQAGEQQQQQEQG